MPVFSLLCNSRQNSVKLATHACWLPSPGPLWGFSPQQCVLGRSSNDIIRDVTISEVHNFLSTASMPKRPLLLLAVFLLGCCWSAVDARSRGLAQQLGGSYELNQHDGIGA